MNAKDFRRIALSLEGAEEGSHMGHADFRVGGRIFATLASIDQGYGNLMLTPQEQAAFRNCRTSFFPSRADGAATAPRTSAWLRQTKTSCAVLCKSPGSCAFRKTPSPELARPRAHARSQC